MNNNNKHWGRRLGATIGWGVLITAGFYIAMFKGVELGWFQTYTGYMTLALGFLVGGLTITDSILKK